MTDNQPDMPGEIYVCKDMDTKGGYCAAVSPPDFLRVMRSKYIRADLCDATALADLAAKVEGMKDMTEYDPPEQYVWNAALDAVLALIDGGENDII